MKIILKNKNINRINNLNKRINKISTKMSNRKIEDITSIFFSLSSLSFMFLLISILFYNKNGFENLSYYAFLSFFCLIPSFYFWFSNYYKKIRQYKRIINKSNKDIRKEYKIDKELRLNVNCDDLYNEILELRNTDELQKIDKHLIQNIIEEYRLKNVPKEKQISNVQRIEHFIENEVSYGVTIENN